VTESRLSNVLGSTRLRVAPRRGIFRRRIGLLLALGLATGCVSAVDLVDSTTPLRPGTYTEIGEADGSSGGFSVFMMQFGASDSVAAARDEALRASGGDALVRVAVESRDFHLLNVFGLHRATVRGIAVKVSQ
jgi:hypothetical protein